MILKSRTDVVYDQLAGNFALLCQGNKQMPLMFIYSICYWKRQGILKVHRQSIHKISEHPAKRLWFILSDQNVPDSNPRNLVQSLIYVGPVKTWFSNGLIFKLYSLHK